MCAVFTICFACKKGRNDCPTTQQYQQLNASAKQWFPYNDNRSLIYESAGSLLDTLDVRNRFLGDGDIWLGDACDMSKGEFLRGNIVDRKSSDTIKVEIGYGDQVLIQKGIGYIQYFDTKGVLILASQYRKFESSITLNGKAYTSVLAFECSPTDRCVSANFTKFYFSKGAGLVAYERNAVLYTLR